VNRGELNWLLQTIRDAEAAERFVFAQYEHGRIPPRVAARVARQRGWINRATNQFFAAAALHSTMKTELPVAIA
jgi:hypothetical protein